jgi:hypothetical protein
MQFLRQGHGLPRRLAVWRGRVAAAAAGLTLAGPLAGRAQAAATTVAYIANQSAGTISGSIPAPTR